jgi:alpha-galactosidase
MSNHALLSLFVVAALLTASARADRKPDLLPPEQIVSFTYGGKSSRELLPAWKREHETTKDGLDVTTITDPNTGLRIRCENRKFTDCPSAVDWVASFENTGHADTPLLENILPLDVSISVNVESNPIFHYSKGSTVGPANDDFIPKQLELKDKALLDLPGEKIPSQAFLPYFNLQTKTGGIIGAIGWTGQWSLHVERDGNQVKLRAGQQLTHLILHPGEKIRTPRILMLSWDGSDPIIGHNQFRRLMIDHYLPRMDGQVLTPEMSMLDITTGLLVPPADQQIKDIQRVAKCGMETYWLDASWFPGDFRFDVGSWIVRTDLFPHGLRPISDAAHQVGMKFLLWIEPERVGGPNTIIAKEHPQWCLSKREPWIDPETGWPGHPNEMMFNLGDREARKWMIDFLSQKIEEWGIDVFREDRNFDPVRYWRAADAPDRQGMCENLYVQGFYEMWDQLRARHPKLIIDSCNWRNTGPDIEVMSRSAGAWTRSEVADCGRLPIANQLQVMGLSLYIPTHANGIFSLDPYVVRSDAIQGGGLEIRQFPNLDDEQLKGMIAEIKRIRPLTLGDFYPLTPIDLDETHWAAWQFDRADLGQGFATFLRRAKAASGTFTAHLRGLDPTAKYELQISPTYDVGPTQTMTGEQLAKLSVQIASPDKSVLVTYQRAN